MFVGNFRNGYINFVLDHFDEEIKLSKHASGLNNRWVVMAGILGPVVHTEIAPLD